MVTDVCCSGTRLCCILALLTSLACTQAQLHQALEAISPSTLRQNDNLNANDGPGDTNVHSAVPKLRPYTSPHVASRDWTSGKASMSRSEKQKLSGVDRSQSSGKLEKGVQPGVSDGAHTIRLIRDERKHAPKKPGEDRADNSLDRFHFKDNPVGINNNVIPQMLQRPGPPLVPVQEQLDKLNMATNPPRAVFVGSERTQKAEHETQNLKLQSSFAPTSKSHTAGQPSEPASFATPKHLGELTRSAGEGKESAIKSPNPQRSSTQGIRSFTPSVRSRSKAGKQSFRVSSLNPSSSSTKMEQTFDNTGVADADTTNLSSLKLNSKPPRLTGGQTANERSSEAGTSLKMEVSSKRTAREWSSKHHTQRVRRSTLDATLKGKRREERSTWKAKRSTHNPSKPILDMDRHTISTEDNMSSRHTKRSTSKTKRHTHKHGHGSHVIPPPEEDYSTYFKTQLAADAQLEVSLSGDGEALTVSWLFDEGTIDKRFGKAIHGSGGRRGDETSNDNDTVRKSSFEGKYVNNELKLTNTSNLEVDGFVVSYRIPGDEGEELDSSRLGGRVRHFVLHQLHADEDYVICVHALSGTRRVKDACATWSKSSLPLRVMVGVLSGTAFLVPCVIIILCIIRKDRRVRSGRDAWELKHGALARAFGPCDDEDGSGSHKALVSREQSNCSDRKHQTQRGENWSYVQISGASHNGSTLTSCSSHCNSNCTGGNLYQHQPDLQNVNEAHKDKQPLQAAHHHNGLQNVPEEGHGQQPLQHSHHHHHDFQNVPEDLHDHHHHNKEPLQVEVSPSMSPERRGGPASNGHSSPNRPANSTPSATGTYTSPGGILYDDDINKLFIPENSVTGTLSSRSTPSATPTRRGVTSSHERHNSDTTI